jgi:hypothetical protein
VPPHACALAAQWAWGWGRAVATAVRPGVASSGAGKGSVTPQSRCCRGSLRPRSGRSGNRRHLTGSAPLWQDPSPRSDLRRGTLPVASDALAGFPSPTVDGLRRRAQRRHLQTLPQPPDLAVEPPSPVRTKAIAFFLDVGLKDRQPSTTHLVDRLVRRLVFEEPHAAANNSLNRGHRGSGSFAHRRSVTRVLK